MPDPNELKAALERLLAGNASDADRNSLRTALTTGVLVTGDRAAAIGGNASDVIIASGDQNTVLSFRDTDAATVQEALSSITPTRLHQVPPPPADFTGRKDELKELLAAIEQGGATISGLQGLGGIGKTALALKLVEQLKPRYPDAQFYLDLKGPSSKPVTVNEALAHVVRAYHPAAKLPESQIELRSLYLSVLEGKRALLLMDNALSAEQAEPLIPPAGCLLLVTSRWHFTLPGLAAKNLDALTPADARALLLLIAPRIGTWADEIARRCGYLPLALRLAAGALAKYRNLKPADYARRLQDSQQQLQLIEASLSLSYELLSEPMQERWRALAAFADSFADDAAAAVWQVAMEPAQDALNELTAASMVEWNETNGRYRLHDLVRVFAKSELSETERALRSKRHALHYLDVLSAANDLYEAGGEALSRGLASFDLEWGNIQTGQAWVAAQGVEGDEGVARLGINYPDTGVSLLDLRQPPRERIRWVEVALAAAKRLKDREAEGNAACNLGTAYYRLGEHQRAIQFYEQYQAIARELGNREGEANALDGLGLVYSAQGDTKRSIEFHEQALQIQREIGNRKGEGSALTNLGVAYGNIGDNKRAIELHEERLAIARELGDRRGEGNALGNLGIAYYAMRDIQRALEFYEQYLAIAREIGDRRGEGIALWNISLAVYQLGKLAEAIEYAEQSVTIYDEIEDPRAAKLRAEIIGWRGRLGQN